MTLKKKKIGLIIGSGDLAVHCLEELVLFGHEITVLRLPCSKLKLKKNINCIDIIYEEISSALSLLKHNNIIDIALIGYMERPEIDICKVSQDSKKILLKVLPALNRGDGEIFTAVKEMLIGEKFNLLKVQDLLPKLTLSSGRYGSFFEEKDLRNEIKAGISMFLCYAKLDVGQSLIFQRGHCLGMETITGTDEMIKAVVNFRKRNYAKNLKSFYGGILIKGPKPKQDLDIDTPVIGPNTIKLANKAKLTGLVVESNKVILVNRDLIIKLLKSYNMFLLSTNFISKDF